MFRQPIPATKLPVSQNWSPLRDPRTNLFFAVSLFSRQKSNDNSTNFVRLVDVRQRLAVGPHDEVEGLAGDIVLQVGVKFTTALLLVVCID